jgi:single-strand DNA-binding protein
MSSLNEVTLVGNLGANPESKKLDGGDTMVKLSLATNERWTNSDGSPGERVDWHKIVVFGNQADPCMEYLSKGSKVLVKGRLRTNTWTDDDGNSRRAVDIHARRVIFLDRPEGAPEGADAPAFTDDDVPF